MNLLGFLVNLLADRPLPGDSPRSRYVAERAPQLATDLIADDHAMAHVMKDACHDIAANPSPAHDRLLRAVRNGDDSGLASEFRILIAQYVLDEARDRADDEWRKQHLERAA
jgi:hypothetical protein